MIHKTYLHVDLDAFFASVEVLDNPELKGKPLIVGGLPGERRSVVSTCSYEARKYGVHSAMPVSRAYELCPQAVFVHGRMERYHEMSQKVMSVFYEFSPDVMQMSIDEAFIDITGTDLLFGDPVTLAKSLKEKVLERTGLTVSIGIASNRYVAKIASGLKKPDGLCYVPAGEEEAFMLSLPLDKLWGIGTKSRERLNACGIFTIPEIHAISETALKELFGEASGSFLYKSVRGMDVEHFGDETKSRSMSAERTFCFDLSDIYAIETELLHLSYDVMFRVLKSKVNSKTVCLKIRYEDFTTVTVTESSSRIVASIEDLFERSCRLFHKKYERGRGIRLLGLGLQNVNDGLDASQGELFDFGEKKQRSVEKTVLKLHQKNPDTKLKKARQFITSIAVFFFIFSSGALHTPLSAQSVEFEIEGSWESLLSSESTVVLGQAAPVLSLKPPVFSQKADLSAWFMYNDRWFFETSVSTDSDKNVVAAGYEGDGLVREFRAGTDIGPGNMSPGARLRLESDKWNASAAVHLDTVQSHSKTWKGSTELVSSTLSLSSYKSGFLYALPDTASASSITSLFIEDKDGKWTDSSGHRFRKLKQDEYLILSVKGLIYLDTPVKGTLLAAVSDKSILERSLPPFLKDTADWFGDRGLESTWIMMDISCADEAAGPSVSETASLFTKLSDGISSHDALFVSKAGFFSPFQVASFYQSPEADNASVSINDSDFSVVQESSLLLEQTDFLIRLSKNNISSRNYSEAAVRFPAAEKYPEIYLPSHGVTDYSLPEITATIPLTSESFSIGTTAVEGTIQALKNGTAVPSTYDRTSGTVTLNTGFSGNDTVIITWDEYSTTSENMLLSMTADFQLTPTPFFYTTATLNSGISLDSTTKMVSASPESQPFVSASLDAQWQRSFADFTLSASNVFSTKALLPSKSMKAPLFTLSGTGTEEIWFLDGASAVKKTPELTKRPSSGSGTLLTLSLSDMASNFVLESKRKQGISGLAWNLSGTLPQNTGPSTYWYAVDIPLSSGAAALPSAHEFSFTITDRKKASPSYDVYLMLGSSTWLISAADSTSRAKDILKAFIPNQNTVQTVTVLLTDYDRMRLNAENGMKLVFVNTDTSSDTPIDVEITGKANAAEGLSFNIKTVNDTSLQPSFPVSVTETPFPSQLSESGWFQPGTKANAACIIWNTADTVPGDKIIVERSIPQVSLSQYHKVALLLFVPENSVSTGLALNLLKAGEKGLSTTETFTVSESELSASKGTWLTITKDISSDESVSKIQAVFDACPAGSSGNAEMYIGGIFLLEPEPSLTIGDEAAASVRWEHNGMSAELSADTTGIRTGAQISVSFPWLILSGNGLFDTRKAVLLSGEYLAAAGNDFLSGIIGFSDNYRVNKTNDSEYRNDTLTLSLVPLKIPFSVSAGLETDRTGSILSEKVMLSASSTYTAGETAVTFTANQYEVPVSSFNYFGTEHAKKQTENASFTQKISLFKGAFMPVLDFGFTNSKIADKKEQMGSFSQKLTLPFSIQKSRFNLSYQSVSSGEYDIQPRQVTFADDIKSYTASFGTKSDRSTISGTVSASWSRNIRADLFDLILPNALTVTSSRTRSFADDNVLDKENASLQLSFSAFNCFGKASSANLFSWYDQDEFQYSVKLTANSTGIVKTELTGYGSLYFDNNAELVTFYTGSISGKDSYNHTVQFSWNRPAMLFEKNAQRLTTGTFATRKENSEKAGTTNAGFSHKATVNLFENFSVSGAAGLSVDIRDVTTVKVTLSLGGKLQF